MALQWRSFFLKWQLILVSFETTGEKWVTWTITDTQLSTNRSCSGSPAVNICRAVLSRDHCSSCFVCKGHKLWKKSCDTEETAGWFWGVVSGSTNNGTKLSTQTQKKCSFSIAVDVALTSLEQVEDL